MATFFKARDPVAPERHLYVNLDRVTLAFVTYDFHLEQYAVRLTLPDLDDWVTADAFDTEIAAYACLEEVRRAKGS